MDRTLQTRPSTPDPHISKLLRTQPENTQAAFTANRKRSTTYCGYLLDTSLPGEIRNRVSTLHLVASFLEYMVVPDDSYNVGVVSTTRRAELDVPPNVPSRSRPRG